MIDIAVPRDIDPAAASVPDVFCMILTIWRALWRIIWKCAEVKLRRLK